MKSVNNKIKKPIVSIGFDAKGKITFNVDLNKTNKLNSSNLHDLNLTLTNIKKVLGGDTSNFTNISKGNQILEILNDFTIAKGISFPTTITLDEIIEVEVCIKNNRKLQAVKTFKEAAGCGLKDGKDFVEWYAKKLNYKFEYHK